jgi:Protein of unknown function (DUF3551)
MPPTDPYACLTSCTSRKPSAVVKSSSPTSRPRPHPRFEPFGLPARLMVGNREAYHARTKALLARPRSRSPRGAGDRNWPYRAARIEHLTPFATVAEAKIGGTQFVREAPMRNIIVAAILFTAVSLCADGAQAAPWCARLNTGLNACSYYSFQQCMAALSGNGGICSPNQFETPYWTGKDARRGYQRAY